MGIARCLPHSQHLTQWVCPSSSLVEEIGSPRETRSLRARCTSRMNVARHLDNSNHVVRDRRRTGKRTKSNRSSTLGRTDMFLLCLFGSTRARPWCRSPVFSRSIDVGMKSAVSSARIFISIYICRAWRKSREWHYMLTNIVQRNLISTCGALGSGHD